VKYLQDKFKFIQLTTGTKKKTVETASNDRSQLWSMT